MPRSYARPACATSRHFSHLLVSGRARRPKYSETAHVSSTAVMIAAKTGALSGTKPSNRRSGGRKTSMPAGPCQARSSNESKRSAVVRR